MSIINSPGVGGIKVNGVTIPNGTIEFTSLDGTIQYTIDPITKKIDLSATAGGAGSFPYKPFAFTLDNTDIANKFVILPENVGDPTKVRLVVLGGTEQVYGDDFTVSGAVVSWNGLPLELLLSSGDKIIVIYT